MAVREIKTTLTLDGEKKFENEIKDASRSLRVMSSEMKSVSADYDLTGDRATYLAQKSQNLKSQLAQQKEIFRALSQAVESSAKSTGEASAKTDVYRIRMNTAAAAVTKLERELRDTDREMEELGRESAKVGRQIEEGIGEAAEETAKSLDEMYAKLKEDVGSIKGSSAVSAVTDLGGAIAGTWQSLDSFAESSRDFNRQMSFLEQNAKTAGAEFGEVKDILFNVAGLTGDIDGAFEGVSNLLATGFDTSEATLAIETLAGAVITFPETVKFENLASDLQESIKSGEAVGTFGEILTKTGISTESFANAMKAAKTDAEKQQVALSFLHRTGLAPVYKDYMAVNGEMVKAETTSLRLEAAWAELAKSVDKYVTPMKEKIVGLIEAANIYLTQGVNAGALAVQEVIGTGYTQEELGAAQEASEGLREELDLLNEQINEAYMAGEGQKAYELIARQNEVIAEIARVEAEAMTKAAEETEAAGEEAAAAMTEAAADAIDAQTQSMETEAAEGGESAGEAMTEAAASAIDAGAPSMEAAAETAAANAMIAAENEVREKGAEVNEAAADFVNTYNSIMNQMQAPSLDGVSEYYYRMPRDPSGAANVNHRPTQTISVNLNVDGKKMASVTTPYVSQSQGRGAQRAETIYG